MKEQKLRQLIREIIEAEIDADGNLIGFEDDTVDFKAEFTRGVDKMTSILSDIEGLEDLKPFRQEVLDQYLSEENIDDTLKSFELGMEDPNDTPEIFGKVQMITEVIMNGRRGTEEIIGRAINTMPGQFADVLPYLDDFYDE